MPIHTCDAVVIGSGVTGLTATTHLLQACPSLSIVNIEAGIFGGLIINVNELQGKVQGCGADLASDLMAQAVDLGAAMRAESVTAIAPQGDGWIVSASAGDYAAAVVIVASGASLKRLDIAGEREFEDKGVSRCADCDGPLYLGLDVVVAGGGDSAVQEALVLAKYCRRVHLVYRSARLAAQPELARAVAGCANVVARGSSEVEAILGETVVERVRVRSLTDGVVDEIACSGFFGFVGLQPCCGFVPSSVARDPDGFLKTDASFRLQKGLFAAGAVRSGYGGALEHAMSEGAAAADAAVRELNGRRGRKTASPPMVNDAREM